MSEFLNIDCMDKERGLPSFPDKHIDLAIVDVPYGRNCDLEGGGSRHGSHGWSNRFSDKVDDWNFEPNQNYFRELFRVSKNQIIWGANHFIEKIPYNFSCWLLWDKGQREFSLSDGELAWTSFKKAGRIFGFPRAAALQEGKIHPTQKPIALYRWLLENYAKPGDLILDTHVGSASSLIACEALGFEYVGFEIDKDYYEAAVKRIEEWRSLPLFDEPKKSEQIRLAL